MQAKRGQIQLNIESSENIIISVFPTKVALMRDQCIDNDFISRNWNWRLKLIGSTIILATEPPIIRAAPEITPL